MNCGNVLELVVGTGQNIPDYPEDVKVTAIDSNLKALKIASERAGRHEADVRLIGGDLGRINLERNRFDAVV